MPESPSIHFECPHCRRRIKVKAELAERQFACPNPGCQRQIVVPATSQPAPVPQARRAGAYQDFISYSAKDRTWGEAARAALETLDINCWIAPRDIVPGTEWGAAIIGGIDACKIMVLVFSAHANDSPQVRREVERAIHKGLVIVPVRVEEVTPSGAMEYALSNTHWLDAFSPPLDEKMRELAVAVRALLTGVKPPPPTTKLGKPSASGRPPASVKASGARVPWLMLLPIAGLLLLLSCGGLGLLGWQLFPAGTMKPDNKQIADNTDDQKAKEKENDGDQQKGDGKTVSTSDTKSFSEDFSGVAIGAQPPGWKCDQPVVVFRAKDDGPHYLHASKEGLHSFTVPALQIRGDFFLECDVEIAYAYSLELTLEGSDSSPSLPLTLRDRDFASIVLPGGEPRDVPGQAGKVAKLRLEREGVIYRVYYGNKLAHARRLRDYKSFGALTIRMAGPFQNKIYGIRVGPWSPEKTGKPYTLDPAVAFRQGFREDFKNAIAGGLPDGWEGNDSVFVRQDDGRPHLEAAQPDKQEVRTPPLRIDGDFYVECECQILYRQALEVKLRGRDGAPSLTINFQAHDYAKVDFPGCAAKDLPVDMYVKPAMIRIERAAGIYRVKVNSTLFHAQKLPDHKDFDGIELFLKGGGTSTKIFSVSAGPLNAK
jgi:hypothetical protein